MDAVVPVGISYRGRRLLTKMLVDSGADFTLIGFRLGRALGFRRGAERVRKLTGVGGRVRYVLKRVTLGLGLYRFRARVAWALSENVPLLLGRLDVFSRFAVTFDEPRGVVTFRPRSETPFAPRR